MNDLVAPIGNSRIEWALGVNGRVIVSGRAVGYLPACIVDCGSAITLDVVDGQGQQQDGLVLPGLAAQLAGIAELAPALPPVELGSGAPFAHPKHRRRIAERLSARQRCGCLGSNSALSR